MWRSSLTLAARPVRHFRQFRTRRNQRPASPKAFESAALTPNVAKNLAFAAGSTCLFFTGGAIYMYENRPRGVGTPDGRVHSKGKITRGWSAATGPSHQSPWKDWWTHLPSFEKTFFVIVGVNTFIYSMWKIPRLRPFMSKFFTRSTTSTRVTPMLLSVFSHNSLADLANNLFILSLTLPPAIHFLGETQFFVLYLTAGVWSSVASHFLKCFMKIPAISMGAGGAIVGMWTLVSFVVPDPVVQIGVNSSSVLTVYLRDLLAFCILVDLLGLKLKWKAIDHAGRLAGLLLGIIYLNGGQKFHQWYTNRVVERWHRFRVGGSGR